MAQSAKQQEQQPDQTQIELIVAAILIGAGIQATANQLSPRLGIPAPILFAVLALALNRPTTFGPRTIGQPSALSEASRIEPQFRAAYILAASRRVRDKVAQGVPREQALRDERRYFLQHMEAMTNRRRAALAVDAAARRYGATLGWHATLDARTTPECRAAHGKNFDVGQRPAIGWPGSVHANCRCKPGRKFSSSQTVYGIKPDNRRIA